MKTPTDTDALKSAVCFNVYSLNRAFARYYQTAFGDTGLTYPKYVILQLLTQESPLSVTALSQRAAVEPNTLSPLLKKMSNAGVISRTRSEEDERRMDIDITPLGRAVVARAREAVERGFEELKVAPEQVAQTLAHLDTFRAALDEATPPTLNFDDLIGKG